MEIGKVMSVRPVLGMSEMLHERPTRASEAWKMEERRAARKRLDEVFILEILMYLLVELEDGCCCSTRGLKYVLVRSAMGLRDAQPKAKRPAVSAKSDRRTRFTRPQCYIRSTQRWNISCARLVLCSCSEEHSICNTTFTRTISTHVSSSQEMDCDLLLMDCDLLLAST